MPRHQYMQTTPYIAVGSVFHHHWRRLRRKREDANPGISVEVKTGCLFPTALFSVVGKYLNLREVADADAGSPFTQNSSFIQYSFTSA